MDWYITIIFIETYSFSVTFSFSLISLYIFSSVGVNQREQTAVTFLMVPLNEI